MPRRFGRIDLPGLPGVALDAVQVSLQPLITLLQVKTSRGFDLSSAIVPTVDVSDLIGVSAAATRQDRVYAANLIAPHAATIRWEYTVPNGRRAILENGSAWIARSAVAAPAATAQADIVVLRGGVAPALLILRASLLDNVVGANIFTQLQQPWKLNAGDVVRGQTNDQSTGGSHAYHIAGVFHESGD